MCERVQVQVDRVTCGSILQTQQLCGCSDGSCVRRSCAAGDLPACAGVDVSWTPPWVSNTLSKGHRGIPCRASGLVQISSAVSTALRRQGYADSDAICAERCGYGDLQ